MTIYHPNIINHIINLIQVYRSFSPIDKNEIRYLKFIRCKIKEKFSLDIKINHLIPIRNIVVSQLSKSIITHIRFNISQIIFEYNNGFDILKISKKYKIPPILTLKQILLEHNYTWKYIEYLFNNINNPNIPIKLKNDIITAINSDHNGQPNMKKIKNKSNLYELKVKDYLEKHNVIFLTENDLIADQKQKFNTLIATPDFFFPDPIYLPNFISKNKIHWLDVKNYTLIDIPIIIDSLKNQANKYNKFFGNGAFMFSDGLTNHININDNILLIDGSKLL
jgi:hypothetical protein